MGRTPRFRFEGPEKEGDGPRSPTKVPILGLGGHLESKLRCPCCPRRRPDRSAIRAWTPPERAPGIPGPFKLMVTVPGPPIGSPEGAWNGPGFRPFFVFPVSPIPGLMRP